MTDYAADPFHSFDDYGDQIIGGHCVPIALALHELTGWPLYELTAEDQRWGHAVVRSPRGFFDEGGLNAAERYSKSYVAIEVSEDELRDGYLSIGDADWLMTRAEQNFETARSMAKSLLDKYFLPAPEQLSLF